MDRIKIMRNKVLRSNSKQRILTGIKNAFKEIAKSKKQNKKLMSPDEFILTNRK
jgi:hypothetical protein